MNEFNQNSRDVSSDHKWSRMHMEIHVQTRWGGKCSSRGKIAHIFITLVTLMFGSTIDPHLEKCFPHDVIQRYSLAAGHRTCLCGQKTPEPQADGSTETIKET